MERTIDIAKKLKDLEGHLIPFEISLRTLSSSLNRLENIDDPAIRHSVFIDRLFILLDLFNSGLNAYISISMDQYQDLMTEEDKDGTGPSIRFSHKRTFEKIQEMLKLTNDVHEKIISEMNILNTWIASPVYSPEHPFGKNYCRNRSELYSEKENIDYKSA